MKTVLFVLDYYLPHRWGVENVFENIILRLSKKWYKIIILTSRFDKKLKKHETISNTGSHTWNIELYRTWINRIFFMMKAVKLWKKILNNKKYNIDIIHASTYGWAIPASILWKKFDKKVILTVHEIFGKLWYKYKWLIGWLIYKFFERLIFTFEYDKYHCVSQNTAKELKENYKINHDKITVIHNGVDNDFWDQKKVSNNEITDFIDKYKLAKNNKNIFRFLYFGHAGKSKWIDYLIKALPEILKLEAISVILNIIESKRTSKILKRISKLTKKSDKLKVFNWFDKDELRVLIASCDCVIAPSISEGFWSVHTEAVAMWKILITTNTSAIPEVVSGKVKFIKPANSADIIAAAKSVVKWNYKKIPNKEFNWDDSVERIERLY